MHKKSSLSLVERGFAFIESLVIILIITAVCGVGWYVYRYQTGRTAKAQSESTHNTVVLDSAPPTLHGTGLKGIGKFDSATNQAEPFVFMPEIYADFSKDGSKGFYEFGSSTITDGNVSTIPKLIFDGLVPGTPIYAVSEGTVVDRTSRQYGNSVGWEIKVRPAANSDWLIIYDYIIEVAVKEGQSLKPGDQIGEATMFGSNAARYSLQVTQGKRQQLTYHCPVKFLTPAVKTTVKTELNQLMTDWNTSSGQVLHNLKKQATPGCLADTLHTKDLHL